MTKYTTAYVYAKKGNLLEYASALADKHHFTPEQRKRYIEEYSREREIRLILLIRHEKGKTYCRIRCPQSPLPVKGEFETSTGAMSHFLIENGWHFKESLYSRMFEAV